MAEATLHEAEPIPDYEREARERWDSLKGNEKDVLIAMCKHGPLWDGDVPSKLGRDGLVDKGLAVRITMGKAWMYRGRNRPLPECESGYNAATARGGNTYRWGFLERRKNIVRRLLGPFAEYVKP